MKKSIYMFIGGSLFGVIAAVTIIKSSNPTQNQAPVAATNPNVKIITAKMQEAEMKNSAMPVESMSDMQVRLSQQANRQGMDAMQENTSTSNPETGTTPEAKTEKLSTQKITQNTVTLPATPPSEQQVQQYHEIDSIIRTAVNNPKVNLAGLIEKADNLTIEQRNQLTQKTLGMLNRGELTIDQFANK